MKIFNSLKRHGGHIGLHRPYSFDEFNRLNWLNSMNMIILWAASILMGIPFFNAKTVADFSRGYFAFSTTFFVSFIFGVLIWKTQSIHEMVEQFETVIQKRKFRKSSENFAFSKLYKYYRTQSNTVYLFNESETNVFLPFCSAS